MILTCGTKPKVRFAEALISASRWSASDNDCVLSLSMVVSNLAPSLLSHALLDRWVHRLLERLCVDSCCPEFDRRLFPLEGLRDGGEWVCPIPLF